MANTATVAALNCWLGLRMVGRRTAPPERRAPAGPSGAIADDRQPAQLGRNRPDLFGGGPGGARPRGRDAGARPADDERDEDHRRRTRVHEARAARVVPSHALLEHAERDGRRGDGREGCRADRAPGRRATPTSDARLSCGGERDPDGTGPQEHADERQARRRCTHTRLWTRLTGMPSRLARSARSALARTTMPMSVRRRNSARATISSGATTSASTSLPRKICDPRVKFRGLRAR